MHWKLMRNRKNIQLSIQATLIIPFLRVFTPSIFLIHWECLSLFILLSCSKAHSLFLASCLLPGPTWWSLPKRHPTCALIAVTDKSLLICATITASSCSDPPLGLPSCRTWNLSLNWTGKIRKRNCQSHAGIILIILSTFRLHTGQSDRFLQSFFAHW